MAVPPTSRAMTTSSLTWVIAVPSGVGGQTNARSCADALGSPVFRASFCVEDHRARKHPSAFAQVSALLRGLSRTNVHTLIT
jgi:hypothetical protein